MRRLKLMYCLMIVFCMFFLFNFICGCCSDAVKFRFTKLESKVQSVKLEKAIKFGDISIKDLGPINITLSDRKVVNSIDLNNKQVKVIWPVVIGGPLVDTLFKMGLIKENKLHGDFIGSLVNADPAELVNADPAELVNADPAEMITFFGVCVMNFWPDFDIIMYNVCTFGLGKDELATPGAIIRSKFISPKYYPLPDPNLQDLTNYAFRASGISLPKNVIDKMINTIKSKPSNELVLYIKQTGEVVSADLEGWVEFMIMP